MAAGRLNLTRAQILTYRRRVGALDARLPPGPESLRHAAWAGLQDSMPRAALLSLHARIDGIQPSALGDPTLVQLWGPRFSVFVVAEVDRPVFTLGRYPDAPSRRQLGEDLADRLDALLDGEEMAYGEAGRALGVHPNQLRYAAPTGRVILRWDGARQPVVQMVPPPEMDLAEARQELARRHLRIFEPTTAEAFATWAGVPSRHAHATYDMLASSLVSVSTPVGHASILASDEDEFRAAAGPTAAARLLPSGDAYSLLHGTERALLVPDADRAATLWTSRVWPGAVLVAGEVVGVWRRTSANLTIEPWRTLTSAEREAVEAEAETMPLPGLSGRIRLRWGE